MRAVVPKCHLLVILVCIVMGWWQVGFTSNEGSSWIPAGSLVTSRYRHSATLLPDGKVLVVGGNTLGSTWTTLKSSEIYDPSSNTWSGRASMNEPRQLHTATLLPNGRVLVTGGSDDAFGVRSTSESYDPIQDTWSMTPPMSVRRREHTATLLHNGKVLVLGGTPQGTDAQANAEIYDYLTNSWTPVAPMNVPRFRHTATLLQDGRVLVVGGNNSRNDSYKSAEIYDPDSNTWSSVSSLRMARFGHSAMLMPNGNVLVIGGIDTTQEYDSSLYYQPFSAEIYDLSQNSWMPVAPPSLTREQHHAVLLTNGTVLLVNGLGGERNSFVHTKESTIYNPSANSWVPAGSMDRERVKGTATLLNDGSVLVVGGFDFSFGTNSSAQLFKLPNTLPIADAGDDLIVEATSSTGAQVMFDGSKSTDADGDSLTYTWYENNAVIAGPTTDSSAQITLGLGTHTIMLVVDDGKGGMGNDGAVITVQDSVPPTVACSAADGVWHASDISILCTARDDGSGLANNSGSSVTLTTNTPANTENGNVSTNATQICDAVGNCTTAGPVSGNRIDKKAPTITIITPENRTYVLHQQLVPDFSCSDSGSGVVRCEASEAGSTIDTTLGTKTLTVTATDQVGNTNIKSVTYLVSYRICLLYDSIRSIRSGTAFPIKISLCDVNGANSSAPAITISALAVIMTSTNAAETLQDVGNSNPDSAFRYDSTLSGYVFNLRTNGFATGSYEMIISVSGDPKTHNLPFQIR